MCIYYYLHVTSTLHNNPYVVKTQTSYTQSNKELHAQIPTRADNIFFAKKWVVSGVVYAVCFSEIPF